MSLSLEEIQKGCEQSLAPVKVSTPEWGADGGDAHVYVRRFRADEISVVRKTTSEVPDGEDEELYRAVSWCLVSVCDKAGELLFDETHRNMLSAGPGSPVLRCTSAALAISGIGGDAAGNSEAPRSDA